MKSPVKFFADVPARAIGRQGRLGYARAPGFGLIELMVSMAIAAFLVLGLATMMSNMQSTYTVQTNNAAVADKERYASAMFSNLIQSAGYYTVTYTNQLLGITTNPTNAFPPVASATSPGFNFVSLQTIAGTSGASASAPDTLNVRYQASSTDNNGSTCLGTSPNNGTYESIISVDTVHNNLICQIDQSGGVPAGSLGGAAGSSMVLIDGVSNMKIMYGVQTYTGSSGIAQTQYLPASSILNGAAWGGVVSIRVTLTFVNPSNLTSTPQNFSEVYQVMFNPNDASLYN